MVSSNGGLLLIREALRETGLIRSLSQALHDPRHPSYIDHTVEEILSVKELLRIGHVLIDQFSDGIPRIGQGMRQSAETGIATAATPSALAGGMPGRPCPEAT